VLYLATLFSLALVLYGIFPPLGSHGGVETYQWIPISTEYCQNEVLETTGMSFEDMAIGVRLSNLSINHSYVLFQEEEFNILIINSTEKIMFVTPAPRSFSLYRLELKKTWWLIIEVLCEKRN